MNIAQSVGYTCCGRVTNPIKKYKALWASQFTIWELFVACLYTHNLFMA